MNQEELIRQFDQWAQTYDHDLETSTGSFPFAGYPQTLSTVFEQARVTSGMTVLDLGVGTGKLTKLFLGAGCQVVGVDFSSAMLAKTKARFPDVELVEADLTADEWPQALDRCFDRIVSNYLFHEFRLEMKIHILSRLARNHLAPAGRIVIGDIIFPAAADLQSIREELADEWEEEFYWTTDETRKVLEAVGWKLEYFPVSFCAGVFTFNPPASR